MNFLDIMLVIVVGWSVIAGFALGFTRVGVGLAGTVLGIVFGFWFYSVPAGWVHDYFAGPVANLVGFLIVLAAVMIAAGIIGRILSNVFRWAGLTWLDRLMGGAFGFVRGVILAVALVTVITAFAPTPPPKIIAESRVMPYVSGAASVMAMLAPSELKHDFRQSMQRLRRYWDEHLPKKEQPRAEPV